MQQTRCIYGITIRQYRQYTYNVTSSCVRVTIVVVEKSKFETFCMCVCIVALLIWLAKRMRRVMLPIVTCLAQPNFSTVSHKRHDFR